LAERGISVSCETVRRWVNHFGPMIAADLRKRRPKPHTTWHLDEVYLKIDGHSPSVKGLFLYYPGHRQVPTALRVFMDMSRAGHSSVGAGGALEKALSRCRTENSIGLPRLQFQAVATASRHALIAAARNARWVWALASLSMPLVRLV
jgi:hypothetical protein